MGKYLHHYETENAFNAAYNGNDYHEPWVSYTNETEGEEHVDYNKQPSFLETLWEEMGNASPLPTKVLITNNQFDYGTHVQQSVTACSHGFTTYLDYTNVPEQQGFKVVDANDFTEQDFHTPWHYINFLYTDPVNIDTDIDENDYAWIETDGDGEPTYRGYTADCHCVKIGSTFYVFIYSSE